MKFIIGNIETNVYKLIEQKKFLWFNYCVIVKITKSKEEALKWCEKHNQKTIMYMI